MMMMMIMIERERRESTKRVKRTFCRFFPFVLRKRLCVFRLVSGPKTDHKMDQNGPKMMTTERRERGEMLDTFTPKQTRLL